MSSDNYFYSPSKITCFVILENRIYVDAFQKHMYLLKLVFAIDCFQDKLISSIPFVCTIHEPFVFAFFAEVVRGVPRILVTPSYLS